MSIRRVTLLTGAMIALSVLSFEAQQVPAQRRLDLLAARRTPRSTKQTEMQLPPSKILTNPDPQERSQLALSIVSIDREVFTLPDRMIMELTLRNVGKGPVTVPWSADSALFDATDTPQLLKASVFVEVINADGKIVCLLDRESLIGALNIPESYIILAPGESASLRVPAVWAPGEAGWKRLEEAAEGEVRIRAVLVLQNQQTLSRSAEMLPVRIQK